MDQSPLEFKEYKNYNPHLLVIRKKIIEKNLNLKNISFINNYNPKKCQYTYTYYNRDGIIYLDIEKLNSLLFAFNQLDNNDIIFSDNKYLENYNHYINRKKIYQVKDNLGIKTVKNEDTLTIEKELKNKYFSNNPERIKKFLSISPEINNFFNYDDLYQRENMECIDKYKLPLYKLLKEDKYTLLKILKNHAFKYTPEDINYFLLHDRLPFVNYQELTKNLKILYQEPTKKYHKIFKKNQEEACLYLLGRNEIIILEEPSGFNIFSKKPYNQEEETTMRKNYIEKFEKSIQGLNELPLDTLNNKDIINIEIKEGKAFNNPSKQYHRGFFSNGLYKTEEDFSKKEELNINPDFLEIDILPEEGNYHTIIMKINDQIKEIPYFYLPEDKEFILEAFIEKIWQRGQMLSHFGKAIYLNESKILPEEIIIPEFVKSSSKKDFEELILNN